MNKWLKKLTRKERLYLLAGAVVLFFGGIVLPVCQKAAATRAEQLEEIESLQALANDYQEIIRQKSDLKHEHTELSNALEGLDYLMYRAKSSNALQTQLMQEFSEMAPSLDLQISSGSASRSHRSQLDLKVSARGTYSRILNLINALETHEPMICIDSIDINSAQHSRRRPDFMRGPQPPLPTGGAQPNLALALTLHVNYRQEAAQ